MFMNRLIDAKRQNRSALLCAATLVAVGAAGCAESGEADNGDELALTGPSVVDAERDVDPQVSSQQGGPTIVSVERDENPQPSRSGSGPTIVSVTRKPVVPGGPAVTGEEGTRGEEPRGGSLSGPYFAEVTANGTGCPAGTWNATISPDGQTFTATFNSYAAYVSPESAFAVKDCLLAIKLKSPQQLTYSVQSFRFSGFAYLQDGVTASQTATFYVQGNPGNSIEARQDLNGPFNSSYNLLAEAELGRKLWSPCSAERSLNVQTRLRLRNGEERGTGYINMAAATGQAKLVARISWRRCDDADELGRPVAEDESDDSTAAPSAPTGGPSVVGGTRTQI